MAITHTQIQITWTSGARSISVTAGGNQTSENEVFNTAAVDAMITLKADNNGTPANGDTVDFFIQYTNGDPDTSSDVADEYDTAEQGTFLATLDTAANDPAIRTVPIRTAAKGFRILATSNAASNAITCSAEWTEVRA